MGETLFISDLHLSPEQPQTVDLFLRFLRTRARQAERLYILGDLFDAWIGDDDDSPPYPTIIGALRTLSDSGTQLFVQVGNRDFLIGKHFIRAIAATLLPDPVSVALYGTPTVLMHGDLLCTDDVPYQRFRRKIRNPLLIRLFLFKSLKKRRALAADYRRRSLNATAAKAVDSMDVNHDAVASYLRRGAARCLIHGHTHRPARHQLTLDGAPAERWVLADWQAERGDVLVATAAGLHKEAVL